MLNTENVQAEGSGARFSVQFLEFPQGRFKRSFHGQPNGLGRGVSLPAGGSKEAEGGDKPWTLPDTLPGGFGSSPLPAAVG